MKKILIIMVVEFLLGGCGADTSVTETEDTFFQDYYSECITMCELNNEWLTQCKEQYPKDFINTPIPDVMECVQVQWYCGVSNGQCKINAKTISEHVELSDCIDWSHNRCGGIPWHCLYLEPDFLCIGD